MNRLKMNRYRIIFITSIILFVILSIVSSIIGTGLFQSFLILTALILLLFVSIGGIAILGHQKFWWDYFKPLAALPIAWGLLHLGFALLFPDTSKEIWAVHWKILLVIELSVFVLNSIVNKNTAFEKRASQKLLVASYVLFFIVSGTMITYRLFWGESAVNLDKTISSRLITSKVELIAGNIEKLTNDQKTKPLLDELKQLNKEVEKRLLTEAELEKKEELITKIKEQYETNANSTDPPATEETPISSRPGTITVPSGWGLYKTDVFINKGERIWLDANPSAILLDCKTGRKIEITWEGILLSPTRKEGKLFFVKQSKSSSVNYRIGI